MAVIKSADHGRSETLSVEPRGTAGLNGCIRLVRVEIADHLIGRVGINVEAADLARALSEIRVRRGSSDPRVEALARELSCHPVHGESWKIDAPEARRLLAIIDDAASR